MCVNHLEEMKNSPSGIALEEGHCLQHSLGSLFGVEEVVQDLLLALLKNRNMALEKHHCGGGF